MQSNDVYMYTGRLVSFVEKYPRDSENIMKHYVSKHFYPEKVFDDLSTDGPKQVFLEMVLLLLREQV